MIFYTLIHICSNEQSIHNNSFTKSFEEQIRLYLSCAKQLHRSLATEGIELVVLTNDKPLLQKLNDDGYNIVITQLDFAMHVPSGIKFYSAHFKLEVFSYLASLREEYVALVDSDMLCVNKMPEAFKTIVQQKLPMYYDITDQMTPFVGAARIKKEKELLSGETSFGLWAGGEFIAGPPSFFSRLFEEVSKIKEAYWQHALILHHQGDEMLTSVAIESIKKRGDAPLLDAGTFSFVGRYWSFVPVHIQKPVEGLYNHFLLHLPSDKKFIARLQPDELKGAAFFKNTSAIYPYPAQWRPFLKTLSHMQSEFVKSSAVNVNANRTVRKMPHHYDNSYYYKNWAIVIPMANEEKDFVPFIEMISFVTDELNPGNVYFIIDGVSKDRTLELCQELSAQDPRYVTVWAPDNRNVVDAYIKGLRVAYEAGHDIIIEMDAGLSHDPRAIPMFLRVLNEGNDCAFGSRFINGGSMGDSPFKRRMLSKTGTVLANLLLRTKLKDMTSGFQGFHRDVVAKIINHPFKSKAHFYQTELRYLLRKHKIFEVPIHYSAPSPRVSKSAIRNSYQTLWYYFTQRLKGKSHTL